MNLQDVLIKFALIADLTLEEAAPLSPICSDAVDEITVKIKDGVDNEINSRRLTAAAAALSFYKYSLYRASGAGMGGFTAGDIKVESQSDASVKSALSVWAEAKDSIADLLADKDFVFRRV